MRIVKSDAISQAPLLPSYIEAACALARRAGLQTSGPRIAPLKLWIDTPPEDRLVDEWIGTSAAFLATGLFTPSQRKILDFPAKEHFLSSPGSLHYRQLMKAESVPVLMGYISGTPVEQRWSLDFGAPALSILRRGDVEVIMTPEQVRRHGSAEALVADGVPAKHLPTGPRPVKNGQEYRFTSRGGSHCCHEVLRWWGCRRQADGTFLYCEDSEASYAERVRHWREFDDNYNGVSSEPRVGGAQSDSKRPGHLRLIIDNTRPQH